MPWLLTVVIALTLAVSFVCSLFEAIILSATVAEIEALKKRLEPAASPRGGEVSLIAALGGGREIEMKLPGRYTLDAALRGALKTAPGVALLEDV